MRKVFLPLFLLVLSPLSFSWSAAGHTAVCQIAYLELTPSAKQKVDALIEEETDDAFRTLGQACVWPDHPPRRRSSDHFLNVPRYWFYIGVSYCPLSDRCIFTAIQQDMGVLRDSAKTQAEKWEALKYLGHWVGDIHQPLHISYADDRGGNSIELVRGFGCNKNLHSVWDKCIPEDLMSEAGIDERLAFGTHLHDMVTVEQRSQWLESLSLVEWADESYQITRGAEVQYCVFDSHACRYEDGNYQLDSGEPKKVLDLTSEYEDEFGEVVQTRIMQAGIRLGAVLNWIFTTENR